MKQEMNIVRGVLLTVVAIIGLIIVFGTVYHVPEGSAGVMFNRMSGFDYEEKPQGFGIKLPIFMKVTMLPFRTQTLSILGDRVLTPKDVNGINFNQEIVIRYRLDASQVVEFYELKGKDLESVVFTATRGAAREVFGQYAQEDVPDKRGEISEKILLTLQKRLDLEKSGKLNNDYIIIEAVDVRNTDFNDKIEQAIVTKQEQKQIAEQREYELQTAQKEKEIIEVRADAKKEKMIREADGEAQAVLMVATAKAEGIRKVNAAYQMMPAAYVQVKFAEAIKPTDKIYLGFDSLAGDTLGVVNYNQLMGLQQAGALNVTG